MKCVHIGCESIAHSRQVCRKHYNELMKVNYAVGGFCKNGHLLDNGNEVFHMRNGKQYVTCRNCRSIAGSMSVKRTEVGDTCKRGHKIVGENAEYYRHNRNNKEHVRCKKCRLMNARERQARFRETPEYKEYLDRRREKDSARRNESQKRADRYDKILAVEVTQTNGSYTGLNYLKLGKRAQRMWEPLAEKFDTARGLCYRNPRPYIDYEEWNTPSPNQAFQLCKGCPLMVECARFASAYKPVVGVWGGEVWENGKVVGK